MHLTVDQILALAPDSGSASNGKKLSNPKHWKSSGLNAVMLWGECQGSGNDPYQVCIELASLSCQCNCPSRKFPCKHGLGLLLMAVASHVVETEQPEWVTHWQEKRQATSARKQERTVKASDEAPSAAQLKTSAKRLATVKKGLDVLDIWLNDLVRQGLANVQTQPASFWDAQAVRLRDAQAGALDTRVRGLAGIPNASSDWPERLLAELGKLALLTHAFRLEDQPGAGMREEVRQLIGWSLTQDEVSVCGETVRDDWLILGQLVDDAGHGKMQRTWLTGLRSGQAALILQFSMAGRPFAEHFAPGLHLEAELTFWPGAARQRAYMRTRLGDLVALSEPLPGTDNIEVFLASVATALGQQPWQERFISLLRNVVPVCGPEGQTWHMRDSEGRALPLLASDGWSVLALSGGHAVDLAAEWDGNVLRTLGLMVEGTYTVLKS